MAVALDRLRGLYRRQLVLSLIEERGALSREQVQLVCFGESEYARWKSQVELKRFYDAKLLRRTRVNVTSDYVYYQGKVPDDLDHLIQVNWVWVALKLAGGLNEFDNEVVFSNLIADAYFVVDGKPYFLELHRHVNRKAFDKVTKYGKLWASKDWDTDKWPLPGLFARVLIVTETESDKKKICKVVERENEHGITFTVTTLDEVRSDTFKCLNITNSSQTESANTTPAMIWRI